MNSYLGFNAEKWVFWHRSSLSRRPDGTLDFKHRLVSTHVLPETCRLTTVRNLPPSELGTLALVRYISASYDMVQSSTPLCLLFPSVELHGSSRESEPREDGTTEGEMLATTLPVTIPRGLIPMFPMGFCQFSGRFVCELHHENNQRRIHIMDLID